MSGARILVRGPAMRCAIVAVLLSRQWAGLGREIVVDADWGGESGEVLLRPGYARFDQEIGFDPEGLPKMRPAFAYDVACGEQRISLPFSLFGMANGGVAFHHFWLRAQSLGETIPLAGYSLALQYHFAGSAPDNALLARLPLEHGIWVAREAYVRSLLGSAQVHEAKVSGDCDLIIDCGAQEVRWNGDTIAVYVDTTLPGIEWLASANAARRIAKLAARPRDTGPARREYIRLASQEAARIADMETLLLGGSPSPALGRKIAVFEACGRIPMEDFEIFTQPEWLAALWAKGHRPARHDRLADAMPEADLKRWLGALGAQIGELSAQGVPA